MTSTFISSIRSGKTAERDGFLAPALYISIFIAMFAVVTQCLEAAGAIGLSTTQQLTMWLVAAGLIVLLWIAYMVCRAYLTSKSSQEAQAGLQARAEKAEAEQAHATAVEASERPAEALAPKAVAEQEVKAARELIAQARQDTEQEKARAEKAEAEAEQAHTTAAEASERLAEALAAKAVAEQEVKAARELIAQARQDTEQQKARAKKAEIETEQAHTTAAEASERLAEALAAKAVVEQQKVRARNDEAGWARNDCEYVEPRETDRSGQVARGQPGDGGAGEDVGQDEDAWLPSDEFKHLDGSERAVSTAKLFPDGCYLEPNSIRPTVDNLTGQQVYECRILDLNQALKDRPHETVVNILANQAPTPVSMPRYGMVDFEHLTITPYVTDRSPMRIRYSLRASGIRPAAWHGRWARPGNVDHPGLLGDRAVRESWSSWHLGRGRDAEGGGCCSCEGSGRKHCG